MLESKTKCSPPKYHTPRTKRTLGFTLVELVVVITILVILGTIAFVSLGGYSRSARDSARVSTISAMLKGLNIALQKNGKHPLPDSPYRPIVDPNDHVTVIGYQGYAGSGVTRAANINGKTTDPTDNIYYTYSVSAAQDRVQFLWLLEESGPYTLGYEDTIDPLLDTTSAASPDYSSRYPFVQGDALGILLSNTGATKNQPLQDIQTWSIDLGSGTVMANVTAYLSASSGSVSGTGIAPVVAPLYNPSATCGIANGGGYLSAPPNGSLCNIGSSTWATNVAGSWKWSCSASNGTNANCSANIAVVSASACGTATGTAVATAPTTNLCATGTPTIATPSWAIWAWNCNDGGGSVLASCSTPAIVSGACTTAPVNAVYTGGLSNYAIVSAPFGTSLTGSYNIATTTNTCQFKCNAGYVYNAGVCSYYTTGNTYTVFNGANSTAGITYTNGGLTVSTSWAGPLAKASLWVSAGKWYYEIIFGSSTQPFFGWDDLASHIDVNDARSWSHYAYRWVMHLWTWVGQYDGLNPGSTYSAQEWVTSPLTFTTSDTVGTTIDFSWGTVTFWKNGTNSGTVQSKWLSAIPAGTTFYPSLWQASAGWSAIATFNFGQGWTGTVWCENAGWYFKYCPPVGYKAISSVNISGG